MTKKNKIPYAWHDPAIREEVFALADQLMHPETSQPLKEMEAGEDLDIWVTNVLDTPFQPYSEDGDAVLFGLQELAKKFDYVGMTFFRNTSKFDPKLGTCIDLPKEEYTETWSLGLPGMLEGVLISQSETDLKVAFCKGVIWAVFCYEEFEKREKELSQP